MIAGTVPLQVGSLLRSAPRRACITGDAPGDARRAHRAHPGRRSRLRDRLHRGRPPRDGRSRDLLVGRVVSLSAPHGAPRELVRREPSRDGGPAACSSHSAHSRSGSGAGISTARPSQQTLSPRGSTSSSQARSSASQPMRGSSGSTPISLVVTHQYVNPLVAIALGMLLLAERPSPLALAGATLVLGAVYVTVRAESPARARARHSRGRHSGRPERLRVGSRGER